MEDIWKYLKKADDLRNLKGDLDGSRKLLEKLIGKSRDSDPEYPIIGAKLAAIYRDIGETELSWEMHEKALASARKQNNLILCADILRAMSFFAIHSRALKDAEDYIRQAKGLVDQVETRNVYEVKATIYAVLGNIEFVKKNNEKALDHYKTALDLAKRANYTARIVTVTGDIANVHIANRDFSEAEKQILSVLQEAESQYRMAVPQLHMRLAKLRIHEGDNTSAVKSLKEALKVAEKEGWERDKAEIYETWADAVKNRKDFLKKSQKIFDKLGYDVHIKRIKKKLKELKS
jgi:tetratricopeptide (TPR) repeat protein